MERITLITQSLKIITDNIPFEETFPSFSQDKELYRLMLMAIPFNPKPIEHTLNLLVYVLQEDEEFYKSFFKGVVDIIMMQDEKDKEPESLGRSLAIGKNYTSMYASNQPNVD